MLTFVEAYWRELWFSEFEILILKSRGLKTQKGFYMFNKYFEFIKALFESVFSKGGEAVSFLDYLYVIFFTLALVAVLAVCVVVLIYSVRLPVLVYKRITRKIKDNICELDEKIANPTEDMDGKVVFAERDKLQLSLTKRLGFFLAGVVLLYIPILVPTLLFLASFIKSWF